MQYKNIVTEYGVLEYLKTQIEGKKDGHYLIDIMTFDDGEIELKFLASEKLDSGATLTHPALKIKLVKEV